METNRTNFTDLPTFKKGCIGEEIVKQIFKEKGWVVYVPAFNEPHCFDMLAIKDKRQAMAIDVKTKARLNKWNAQGINVSVYNEYLYFKEQHNMPFYLFFIDDKSGDIHYQEIGKLEKAFKISNDKIICWPLDCMIHFGKITPNQIEELSKYDTRNYIYLPA